MTVLADEEVLPAPLAAVPGWLKQQIIKLHADEICGTPIVACQGADTIVCKPVGAEQLLLFDTPILYFNRYPHTSEHLNYERGRVKNVARILRVEPRLSLPFGDFIMDFMLFEAAKLRQLRARLRNCYGENAFLRIIPKSCDSMESKMEFGEWTLYAVFLLDVLGANVPIRNSNNRFVAQVHSQREFESFHFDAHVIHFVDKSLDVKRIRSALEKYRVW